MIDYKEFSRWVLELIKRASTDLPEDIESAIAAARDREHKDSASQSALCSILENIELARKQSTPICQDTGTNIFHIYHPTGTSTIKLRKAINTSVKEATSMYFLRPNAVDSLSGVNSGSGIGKGLPSMHFHEWDKDELLVKLLLKGGGSENVGAQYSLPDSRLGAGRDLAGVEIALLDAIQRAQGKGCAPGVAGVCIGGDRGSSYAASKEQLFRKLDDENPIPELRDLEKKILDKANDLGIGPMGFGGKTTVLGVKIGALHRLPASYFVSVSYMCWACRRREMRLKNGRISID